MSLTVLPSLSRALEGASAASVPPAPPAAAQSTRSSMYCLDIQQQPRQARMAGSGEKADRRTVDPPPIVRLRIRRPHARRKSLHSLTDDDLVSPTLTHTHFCFASLVPENSEEELFDSAGSKSKLVGGSVVSSLFHLRDQSCFVFPDLSVRTEGRWRFKMSMYEIVEDGVIFCDSVLTDVFQVYSSKRFPGMGKSTELSKSFAQQGLKLRIRRPEANEAEDETQPRRKKAKPTPRQRSRAPVPPDTVPLPPTPQSVRRASGPADFSHAAPLIAPIGSTTSTPQQRPWTSWNASPSKVDPRYPDSSSFSQGFPSRPPSSHAGLPRSTSHDYRRLPRLDERNTAPGYSRPGPLDPSPVPFSSHRMPPPPPRHSPPILSRPTFLVPSPTYTPAAPPPPPPRSPPPILAPLRSDFAQQHPPQQHQQHQSRPVTLDRTPSLKWSDPFALERQEGETRTRSNESSIRTSSEEDSTPASTETTTSLPLSDASEDTVRQEKEKIRPRGGSGGGGGGSLAMLLGDGASDPKRIEQVSFF